MPRRSSQRTFRNPVIPGFHPDPSVCRVGKSFYLAASSFEYFPGVPLFHSTDLVHWKKIGHALTRESQLRLHRAPSSGGIYAPTLRYQKGRFYLITTNVSGRGNFYVTARRAQGPWSEPVWLDRKGIDPSLLFTDDGVHYTRNGPGRDWEHPLIFQARLDLDGRRLLGRPRPVFAGTGGPWVEGPHLYRRGGVYYLMAAEGGTGYGHSEVVARSEHPFGPFHPNPRNPILSHRDRRHDPIQATGHADLVDLADGSTWAVFLGIRPTRGRHHHLGRETFLAPVTWGAKGWPVIGNQGRVKLWMPAPPLPSSPFPEPPPRDDFRARSLGLDWCFIRNPRPRDWSLTERPSHLRLKGSAVTLNDVASPAFVGRRQQHFELRCRALLRFEPRRPNEEAGLTLRANEDNHYDLCIRGSEKGREARLVCRQKGVMRLVRQVPLGPGAVVLEIESDPRSYWFRLQCGTQRADLGRLPTRALSTETLTGSGRHHFTGVVIGLYATGNGKRSTTPADFDWFEYRKIRARRSRPRRERTA